jgi:hypothetical protein
MDKDAKVKAWLCCAAFFAFIVILCVAGRYVTVFSTYIVNDQEKWGQFGDYFGGVLNPILSFFAFLALLITLRTQFVANEASERRHDEQLVEQRLFQLIGLMNENALSTKIVATEAAGLAPAVFAHGHQAQHSALIQLRVDLAKRLRTQISGSNDLEIFESAERKFKEWRRFNWPSVGLYVDSVFLVLDFILREKSGEDFKIFALRMLRVQLSESERLLLWYSAMFTAEYVVYLDILLKHGFVDDHDGSLDDQIKPWREKMIQCSRLWSNIELEKRSA